MRFHLLIINPLYAQQHMIKQLKKVAAVTTHLSGAGRLRWRYGCPRGKLVVSKPYPWSKNRNTSLSRLTLHQKPRLYSLLKLIITSFMITHSLYYIRFICLKYILDIMYNVYITYILSPATCYKYNQRLEDCQFIFNYLQLSSTIFNYYSFYLHTHANVTIIWMRPLMPPPWAQV